MLLMHTYAGDGESDLALAANELSRYYCYFGAWFKNERPVRQAFIAPLSEPELTAETRYAPELMRRNLVIGTPDDVIARLQSYKDLGYDQYSLWIDSGMPFERKKRSLERFIRDVMPIFH
jgi:flavin-dependent trigonelline monooxygenase, oxygenase component